MTPLERAIAAGHPSVFAGPASAVDWPVGEGSPKWPSPTTVAASADGRYATDVVSRVGGELSDDVSSAETSVRVGVAAATPTTPSPFGACHATVTSLEDAVARLRLLKGGRP